MNKLYSSGTRVLIAFVIVVHYGASVQSVEKTVMIATETSTQNNGDEQELGDGDLQLLLRSKLGKQVIVLHSTTSSFLPPGENFACRLSKITATVKRDENATEETLNLVAKLYPESESIKAVFDFTLLFGKEIFCYEKLLPMFKDLETEFDAESASSEFAPKLFGTRLSADPSATKIDEGVIVLMENLKARGYYTLDKIKGSDLTHSRMMIATLARFHALGVACKQHRPKFFQEEVQALAKVVSFNEDVGQKGNIFELLMKMMLKDSRIAKYSDRISKLMDPSKMHLLFEYVAPEPWVSIAHMDFWTANVLYHKDEAGNLDDVKFIDFQNYVYTSPLRDLPYFLCTSTSHEVMTQHFDELLDLYYETFVDVLKKTQCDVGPFTRQSFDEQLKIDSSFEFFHNILAIKFFSAEIDKDTYDPKDLQSVVIYSDINALGYDKWYQIILTYIERGWL